MKKKLFSLIGLALLGVIAYAGFSKDASADKTWSFNPLTAIAKTEVSGGNLIGGITDDGGASWSSMYNNAAVEKAELTTAEGVAYSNTAGLKFTAGGSKWIYFRNYPEAYNGAQLFSNNKDLRMFVPAAAGKAIIFKAMSASGTIQLKALKGAGADTVVVDVPAYGANKYDYYMVVAQSDEVEFNLPKQFTMQEVKVCDVPTQADNTLTVAGGNQVTLSLGETKTLAVENQNNATTPVTYKSLNEAIVTVKDGVLTAVGSGEAQVEVAQVANPYFKATTQVVTVTVKRPKADLVSVIADAVAGKAYGETATVTLDGTMEYKLDAVAPAGLVNLVINGNGAIVVQGENGQLTAMQGIEINKVNFDCTNGKLAPVALDSNPDSVLWCKNEPWATTFAGANQQVFYNVKAIVLEGCNFSDLKAPLFDGNKQKWALVDFKVNNCIAEFNYNDSNYPTINFYGGPNSIKNISITNSTLYNRIESNKTYFLRYSNASNAKPAKAWGTGATASWVMSNNTFVNMCSAQNFANNYVSDKTDSITWTKNVFYNCYRLNKAIGNCTVTFTNVDNSIWGVTNSVDATDKSKYATEDNTLISTPTEAFNFDENSLFENFGLLKYSSTYANKMGDPRWLKNTKKTYPTRSWDFSSKAIDATGDDWKALQGDNVRWSQTKANDIYRYTYLIPLYGTEFIADVNGKNKFAPTEGLFFTVNDAKSIHMGCSSKYPYIQFGKKGQKVTIKDVHAADTVFIWAVNDQKSADVNGLTFENGYPEQVDLRSGNKKTDLVDCDTIIVKNDGDFTIVHSAAKGMRLQKVIVKAFDGDYRSAGIDYTMAGGNKNLRMDLESTDTIIPSTANAFVPCTYTSSDENVAVVSADGVITPVNPGIAYITVAQAAFANFTASSKQIFVQVLPSLDYHVVKPNAGLWEVVYSPNAVHYDAESNNYFIAPAYATWMEYINATNGNNIVTAKKDGNCWMKINYLTDEECSQQCPAGDDGNNSNYVATVYNSDVRSMNYKVTNCDAAKFYYSSSSGSVGALKVVVYCGKDSITQVIGSEVKGKKSAGMSSTVLVEGLDPLKNYTIKAMREGSGDVTVYAAKFHSNFTYMYVPSDTVVYTTPDVINAMAGLGTVSTADKANDYGNFAYSTNKKSTLNPETGAEESVVRPGVLVKSSKNKVVYLRLYADANASVAIYATNAGTSDDRILSAIFNNQVNVTATATAATSNYVEYALDEGFNEIKITATGDMCFYAFKVTYNKTGAATGIEEVKTEGANASTIYNLRGQKVNSMNKGEVYIIDGKKFMIK